MLPEGLRLRQNAGRLSPLLLRQKGEDPRQHIVWQLVDAGQHVLVACVTAQLGGRLDLHVAVGESRAQGFVGAEVLYRVGVLKSLAL